MITKLCVDFNEVKEIVQNLKKEGVEVKVFKCKELLFVRREKVQFIVNYKE